jgi:hypothetical protein
MSEQDNMTDQEKEEFINLLKDFLHDPSIPLKTRIREIQDALLGKTKAVRAKQINFISITPNADVEKLLKKLENENIK